MSEIRNEQIVRLLIVEDHVMRRGIKGQFALEPGFSVVAAAADGSTAVQLATQLQPDVVLMDIDLPVMDGITATWQIKSDRSITRVLALSAFDNDTQVMGMLKALLADNSLFMYCVNAIPARDWVYFASKLEANEFLLRDRIGDLLGREQWRND